MLCGVWLTSRLLVCTWTKFMQVGFGNVLPPVLSKLELRDVLLQQSRSVVLTPWSEFLVSPESSCAASVRGEQAFVVVLPRTFCSKPILQDQIEVHFLKQRWMQAAFQTQRKMLPAPISG